MKRLREILLAFNFRKLTRNSKTPSAVKVSTHESSFEASHWRGFDLAKHPQAKIQF